MKRQRMPWLWPDPIFRLTPQGREHERCLQVIHQFTGTIIQERVAVFKAEEVRSKRSAFLGMMFLSSVITWKRFSELNYSCRCSFETDAQRKFDFVGYSRRSGYIHVRGKTDAIHANNSSFL